METKFSQKVKPRDRYVTIGITKQNSARRGHLSLAVLSFRRIARDPSWLSGSSADNKMPCPKDCS